MADQDAGDAPAASVEVPAESAQPPAASAEAPAESAEAPAAPAEAPAESAEAPAESAELPAESAEAPAASAEAPAESAEAPAESAEAPAASAEGSPETAEPPAESAQAPAESAGISLAPDTDAVSSAQPVADVVASAEASSKSAASRPATLYIKAGSRETRLLLCRAKAATPEGDEGISAVQLEPALRPLRELGAGLEGEDAAGLLKRRSEFAESLGDSLRRGQEAAQGERFNEVVLGLTSWYRELPEGDVSAYEGLWDLLRQQVRTHLGDEAQLKLLPLTAEEESHLEHRAAVYACARSLGADVSLTAVLGPADVDETSTIRCSCGSQSDSAVGQAQLPPQVEETSFDSEALRTSCEATCSEVFASCAAALRTSGGETKVCALGRNWQAAAVAGLASDSPSSHEYQAVLTALKEKAEDSEKSAKDRANLICTTAALQAICGPGPTEAATSAVQVIFAKEWNIDGADLQVSWAIGHFLQQLPPVQEPEAASAAPSVEQLMQALAGASSAELTGVFNQLKPESRAALREAVAGLGEADAEKAATEAEASEAVDAKKAGAQAKEGKDSEAPKSSTSPKAKLVDKLAANTPSALGFVPGVVIYIVAPGGLAEATLSSSQFSAISAAALRSGASVVLSASSPSLVADLDSEEAKRDSSLRPLAAFAVSRFAAPGSSRGGAYAQFFEALAPRKNEISAAGLIDGLRRLGFAGDAEKAAEAATGEGMTKVMKADFCECLDRASQLPDVIAVCVDEDTETESGAWPQVRSVVAGGSQLASPELLRKKSEEALEAAGSRGHGIILVLAARGRASLQPAEYERQMRGELQAAVEQLPGTWPLLWAPGPAEVGLLPTSSRTSTRPNWSMPQASVEDLQGWLRYLLAVRPAAPAA
eukprot:TRINITY_DN9599_c0_g1_i2.p1 TRINITY_DN9599_c0_g1~~TRINITY_DN9599_c0_g1_i2.p1  ORF type:complete len:892 (+),score=254.79 TRINITY_DN9599_c0_g1_i2:26-2677(+)